MSSVNSIMCAVFPHIHPFRRIYSDMENTQAPWERIPGAPKRIEESPYDKDGGEGSFRRNRKHSKQRIPA